MTGTLFKNAQLLDPEGNSENERLGSLLVSQGRIQESLVAFKRAVPEAEAYANLAYALAQRGEFDQALAHYSHALTLDNELRHAGKAMLQIAERQQQLKIPSPARVAKFGRRSTLRTCGPPDMRVRLPPRASKTNNAIRPGWRNW